ncbi:MAG: lysoplasmalogenase [Clostridiales bacterium]|nr:lysoplasmalogenase [Clostridiales bacterium]
MTSALGLAAACFILMAFGCFLYLRGESYGFLRPKAILAIKGGTTLLAAFLAFYGFLQSGLPAHFLISVGIAVCAAADVVLNLRFKLGMLVFALGHICYISAFVIGGGIHPLNVIIYFIFIMVILLLSGKLKNHLSQAAAPFLAYSFIIAAMFSLALTQPLLAALGALLFVLSDSLLFLRFVMTPKPGHHAAVMSAYYLAQFFLALSLMF